MREYTEEEQNAFIVEAHHKAHIIALNNFADVDVRLALATLNILMTMTCELVARVSGDCAHCLIDTLAERSKSALLANGVKHGNEAKNKKH